MSPEEINPYLTKINSSPLREKSTISSLIKRPEIGIKELEEGNVLVQEITNTYTKEQKEQAEIKIKYEKYIEKELLMAEKIAKLDEVKLNTEFDYMALKSLSIEARQKLTAAKPMNLGQASRISGVSPADISVLMLYLGR